MPIAFRYECPTCRRTGASLDGSPCQQCASRPKRRGLLATLFPRWFGGELSFRQRKKRFLKYLAKCPTTICHSSFGNKVVPDAAFILEYRHPTMGHGFVGYCSTTGGALYFDTIEEAKHRDGVTHAMDAIRAFETGRKYGFYDAHPVDR